MLGKKKSKIILFSNGNLFLKIMQHGFASCTGRCCIIIKVRTRSRQMAFFGTLAKVFIFLVLVDDSKKKEERISRKK